MLEKNDLKFVVKNIFSIDEYRAKMGEDSDICVIAFECISDRGAEDLCDFIEKGYDFVLDADVSLGAGENGLFYVYVEIERNKNLPKHIVEIIKDVCLLTDTEIDDWRFRYYRNLSLNDVDIDTISKIVPCNSEEYCKFERNRESELSELATLRMASGLPYKSITKLKEEMYKKPESKEIAWLLKAAGIK